MNSQANLAADTAAELSEPGGSRRGPTKKPESAAFDARFQAEQDTGRAGVAGFARQAGAQAKRSAESLASEAKGQIKGALDAQVQSGVDLVARVAESVKVAADHLEPDAPHLAGVIRAAADRIDDAARSLEGQSAQDLVRTTSDFIRREPGLAFGVAAAAGFALVRLLKIGTRSSPAEPASRGR